MNNDQAQGKAQAKALDELLANPDLAQPMDDNYFEGLKHQLRSRHTL